MILPLVLSTSLALCADDAPSPPSEEAAVAEVHTVGLVIDSEPLLEGESAEYVEKVDLSIRRNLTTTITQTHGLAIASPRARREVPTLIIRLEWKDARLAVYTVTMAVRWPNGQQSEAITFTEGMPARSMVVEELTKRLPQVIEILRSPPPARAEPAATVAEEPAEPAAESSPDPDVSPDHAGDEQPYEDTAYRPLGPLGLAGIGVIATGGVAAGAGLGLVLRGRSAANAGEQRQRVVDTQPPGIALLVGGGVALATGVALLVVDRRRAKSTPIVSFTPGGVSLGIATRF